jgi:hypothetical protein
MLCPLCSPSLCTFPLSFHCFCFDCLIPTCCVLESSPVLWFHACTQLPKCGCQYLIASLSSATGIVIACMCVCSQLEDRLKAALEQQVCFQWVFVSHCKKRILWGCCLCRRLPRSSWLMRNAVWRRWKKITTLKSQSASKRWCVVFHVFPACVLPSAELPGFEIGLCMWLRHVSLSR